MRTQLSSDAFPQTKVSEIFAVIKTARTLPLDRLNQDLTQQHHRLTQAVTQLKALSPSATLDRGFAIVQVAGKEACRPIRDDPETR